MIELKTLDPPQRSDDFIKQLAELTHLKNFEKKIKLKARDQVIKHVRLEDLDDTFDIDFDTVETPAAPSDA